VIQEVHGDPYGIEQALLNIPNYPTYSSDVSCVLDFEGGLGDISWVEAGDPPTISFQAINKFDNAGIRDVTIGVGGSIIIAEGAFPDTIVYTSQTLGNQDVFLNNVDVDDLTEKARNLTGVEGLYLYTPFTQEGSVQCDMTAGVPPVNYGGNTYAWNWYDEATFAFIWDMIPNQTVPSEIFICQYNTSEGNPNDPAISRMMIDTMIRYMIPRLVAAMQLGNTTGLQELNPQDVSFQLYPNPSADFVNLRAAQKIQHIQVKDLSGKVLESRKVNEWQTEIPVYGYAPGFYIFEISFNEGILHQKALIAR
jgi:hypothetical protein